MSTRLRFFLLLVICCAAAATVPAQAPNGDVRVDLSLQDGKAVYRAGEAITLVLSFTGNSEGYQLNITTTKPASPIDDVILSPTSGAFNWLDQYSGRNRYAPDYMNMGKLSATPTIVKLPLNDWFRFDKPGRYAVRVKTNRVTRSDNPMSPGPALSLTTNEVRFEIKSMSEAEEEAEVRRLSALIDAAKSWQDEARISEELASLTGDASTREKARRFLNQTGRSGNYSQNISLGLFMARNQKLLLELLEAGLRDLKTPAGYHLVQTLIGLRLFQERPFPTFQDEQLRKEALQSGYVAELLATLPQRQGQSRGETAMTILMSLPRANSSGGQASEIARAVVLQEFPQLNEFGQEYLLRVYWEQIRTPALAPAIRQILQRAATNPDLKRTALQRYLELSPEEARPFIIEQIRNPVPLQNPEILLALKDEMLPELDQSLLEQIRISGEMRKGADFGQLKQKTALAARYASPAIYQSMLDLYQNGQQRWHADAPANVLAYLTKYDEKRGLALINQALTELQPGQEFSFLSDLTNGYYSEGIGDLLRQMLQSDQPETVSLAAYLLSKHGNLSDQKVIAARLDRWLQDWRGRESVLSTNESDEGVRQAMLQVNLLEALTRAKAWKLSEAETKRLEETCLTQRCRQIFPIR
ncbi:MAG: hypothetical protein QOE77_1193 [Blastocatellia bacterium]|jgi:hypothetical protein|nr:hypothetical protein [Blastocatellia bacterium]